MKGDSGQSPSHKSYHYHYQYYLEPMVQYWIVLPVPERTHKMDKSGISSSIPGITIPGSHRTIVARHPPWALWGTFYRYSSDSEWNRRSTAMFIPEYTHYDPSIPILIFLSLFQKLTTCFGPPQGGENSTGCHPGECQIHHDPVMNCDDVSYQCSFRHSAPIQPTTLLP